MFNLSDLYGVFLLLVAGYLIGLTVFITEYGIASFGKFDWKSSVPKVKSKTKLCLIKNCFKRKTAVVAFKGKSRQ